MTHRSPGCPQGGRFLLLLFMLWLVAGAALAVCPTDTGVEDVHISYIDLNDDSVPDINGSSKERNEHARISSSLAGKLGITDPTDDVYAQIRVITQNQNLANGHPGTGIFSVYEVYDDLLTDEIQVWADEDATDNDSGEYRIFEDVVVANLSAVRLTVHAQAPSATTVTVNSGSPVVTEHFCEPHADSTMTEFVETHTDKRFALMTPHGGFIEPATSDQITTIANTLDSSWNVDTNVWDVQAFWHDDDDESEHWHITSSEVGGAGFPGLDALIAEPKYNDDRDFQYVVSLHGMRFSKEGMVIGGRASREAKCLIASRVRQRMIAESEPVPAIYVWNYDKDFAESIELAHGDGSTEITDERGSDPGLSGTSSDNIVNRFSPNSDGAPGFGGIQIEQSPDLRNVDYRDLVAEEIANAIGELINKPTLISSTSTPICDALIADQPAPTAEVRGYVWWDEGDEVIGAGDRDAGGVEVSLLTGGGALLETTFTDAEGGFVFTGLAAGSYQVEVSVSPVIDFVAADQGADSIDSDVDPLTGRIGSFSLVDHETLDTLGAGLVLAAGTGAIGDLVWHDDGDGIQGGVDDVDLADVAIELRDADSVLLDTALSDVDGSYQFSNLPAGTYQLRFLAPAGYEAAQANATSDDLDSDIDINGDVTVVLAANQSNLDVDAGFTLDCVDATLVAYGSNWRYSTTQSANWQAIGFDDSGWSEDQGTLGFGTSVESTIGAGSPVYFRLAFEVEDPLLFDSVDLSVFRNDGAVAYLNGTEVLRSNVPVSGSSSAIATQNFTPSFAEGTNVLAVEVHHSGDNTLAFGLEMTTRICRPCVERVTIDSDRMTYVRSGSSSNRGGRDYIRIDASTEENGLLAWPLGGLPTDAEVLHAAIDWTVEDGSSDTFHLYPVLTSWDEATADWFRASDSPLVSWQVAGIHGANDYDANRPLAVVHFPSTGLGRMVLNTDGREVVQSWLRGSMSNDGILVPGEGSGNKLQITSDDLDSGTPPVLELVYRSCGN